MECNLCEGEATSSDSVEVVVWNTKYGVGMRSVEITPLTLYICKECMHRYKAQQYGDLPQKGFLPMGIISAIIGVGLIISTAINHPNGGDGLIAVGIMAAIIMPFVLWLAARRIQKQLGPASAPLSPHTLPLRSAEISAAVFDCAGDVQYAFPADLQKHQKNHNYVIPKERSYRISFYKLHPLNQILESRPKISPVTMEDEVRSFVRELTKRYGKGQEFKAIEAFDLISDGYLKWFTKTAQAKNIYSINGRESAALELLEFLQSKGIVGNKRKVVRNEYGDEEWFYTLL